MNTDEKPQRPERKTLANQARDLVREAMTGTLATLDRGDGTPYASLVSVATLHDGRPVLLISRLALHTQNVAADPRVSLLVDRRESGDDALALARVTLMGRLRPSEHPSARARYLARHPAAAVYADFADFGFYELDPERGHFVGGFGRITPLSAVELVDGAPTSPELLEAEAGIIAHMNEDHADTLSLMARVLCGAGEGPWRIAGVDADGFDMVRQNRGLRLAFPGRVTSADDVRRAFIALVAQARKGGAATD